MHQYLQLLDDVEKYGYFKGDRTGTGTTSLFGRQFRFSLKDGELPVVTTKKIHLPSVEYEHDWMKSGDTQVDFLIRNGVTIWNEWVKPETATYEDLPVEFLTGAVQRKFGNVNFNLIFSNELDKDWTFMEATVNQQASLVINLETWGDYKRFGPGPGEYDFYAHALRVYLIVIGKGKLVIEDGIAKRLTGGDLGPVYGKTWRNIEDTRIVLKAEQTDYEKRGFKHIVDIPSASHVGAECVVHRRVDQVKELLDQLATNPDSRRLIICAWDPRLVEDQALPPCHAFIQFWTRELSMSERMDIWAKEIGISNVIKMLLDMPFQLEHKHKGEFVPEGWTKALPITEVPDNEWQKFLDHYEIDFSSVPKRAISCQLYQRSADTFLGVPFNITFYSLMTHQLANQFNMVAEEFIWTGGDCHIYSNHEEQCKLQRTRNTYPTPTIRFKPEAKGKSYLDITRDDYVIENYQFHPHIAGKVAV